MTTSSPYRSPDPEPRYRVIIDGQTTYADHWRDAIRSMRRYGVGEEAILAAGETVVMNGWTDVSIDVHLVDPWTGDVFHVVRPCPRYLPKSIGSAFGFRFRRRPIRDWIRATVDRAVCP